MNNWRMEYRTAIELRAGPGRRLEGYCAVFGTVARIGNFTETIRQGAFAKSLASSQDIIATVDHDTSKLLARTKSGTLRLSEDARGLHFDLSVPSTSVGSDILEMAQRGDVGGASFSFRAIDDAWQGDHRELRQVDLREIAIIQTYPAYPSTSVNARSRDMIRDAERARLRQLLVETL